MWSGFDGCGAVCIGTVGKGAMTKNQRVRAEMGRGRCFTGVFGARTKNQRVTRDPIVSKSPDGGESSLLMAVSY
jgi:hypothetical protein